MRRPLFPLDPIKDEYYYPGKNFVEQGSEGCDELDLDTIDDADVRRMFKEVEAEPLKELYRWFLDNKGALAPT